MRPGGAFPGLGNGRGGDSCTLERAASTEHAGGGSTCVFLLNLSRRWSSSYPPPRIGGDDFDYGSPDLDVRVSGCKRSLWREYCTLHSVPASRGGLPSFSCQHVLVSRVWRTSFWATIRVDFCAADGSVPNRGSVVQNARKDAPIGCLKTPFNPFLLRLSASGWTSTAAGVKLQARKGLPARWGTVGSLIENQGPFIKLGALIQFRIAISLFESLCGGM